MLVCVALPVTTAVGGVSEKEETETISLEYVIFGSDGSKTDAKLTVDSDEISKFREMIPQIYEKISSNNNFNLINIVKDLKKVFGLNGILSLFSRMSGIRPLQKRVFIISDGYGSKFDFNLRPKFSIYRDLSFWSYSNNKNSLTNSLTLVVDPIPNSGLQFVKLVNGMQIGMMSKFTGFYMRIPGKFMEDKQSHTLFFGYAKKVRVLDLFDNTPSVI